MYTPACSKGGIDDILLWGWMKCGCEKDAMLLCDNAWHIAILWISRDCGNPLYAWDRWWFQDDSVTDRHNRLVMTNQYLQALSTPVNTGLLLLILYYVKEIVYPPISKPKSPQEVPTTCDKGYSWMPASHSPAVVFQTYTPRTLVKYDGKENGRILLAIDGMVFDVTAGRNFYGPGKCNMRWHHGDFCLQLLKMACMAILPGVTLVEAWQSSRLTWVSWTLHILWLETSLGFCAEMLTPIDEPLDKLQDLDASEMWVFVWQYVASFWRVFFSSSENMRGKYWPWQSMYFRP